MSHNYRTNYWQTTVDLTDFIKSITAVMSLTWSYWTLALVTQLQLLTEALVTQLELLTETLVGQLKLLDFSACRSTGAID